ncbi:MAG TPA: hypothetical protein QF624_07680 [Dehalococcoidia bacterium]|nr:hypothetical protein [Dehalococcoidia bacterium]
MSDTLLYEHVGHRGRVIRKALMHGPLGVFTIGVTLWLAISVLGGNLGALFGFLMMALISFAIGLEGLAALRDLVAVPVRSRGEIQRAWSKGRFLFLGTIHYILVEKRVFEVEGHAFSSVQEGNVVELQHWPHTNVVASIHLVEEEPEEEFRPNYR